MQDMHRKWQACGRWLLKINNHVGSYMNDRPFASVKISGTGFVTLNNMLLIMYTRFWWETRLTWMKAKGYRQYHTQMHLVISWFEQSTGVGFVKLYTRHSLASSDHFQENSGVSSKSLGKEDSQGGKMEGSRLKFIDNHLKQQKFLGSWE
ncbi:BEL1-like homeodomain protein 1 isoform X3 [Daucus carota subsp. sativus]|uniref:BEL1-like homeodomain protein 1 isoform X3 n=1 Tax=Daucus carota subsp. sativus TaxID=79200 RepID=UPI003083CBFE